MISYVKNQPEYFRCSKQFYYFIADLQGHISYSNPLFADLTTENFVEKIFSEKDNRSFLNAIQQCFRGRGPQSVKTSSPQVKWEVSLVVDDINNPEAVQAIGVNIDSNTINDQLHYQATILANVSDIIVTTDMGSKIKSWNRMAEMFYGIKEKIAIGQDVSDLLTLDYWPITRELMHKQLFEKGTWKGEVGFINPAGEKKYLLNTVSFVLNSDGERIGKLVFGKDITDRKQAEAKLRQSEQFYRNLFANSLDGILLTDESGKIYFSSSAVKMTLGYDIEEINGRNAFEFVHPEDHQKALAAFMNEVDESPEVKFILIRLLKKTGEYVWCNVRGHNLLNISNIGRIAIYLYDDSLRKQAEDALKESEQRFRNLVDNIQHGVILRDQNNKAIICNRAVLEIMGFEPADILNKTLEELGARFINEYDEEVGFEAHPSMIAAKTKKPVRDVVLGLYRKNKRDWIWVLLNADPILDESGEIDYIIISFADITIQKRLSRQLIDHEVARQKLLTQLAIDTQEKERTHIGKELHDNIGQQLTTTKLYLELSKEKADDVTLEMISLASKSVSDVINEIRKLSRSLTPPTLGDLGIVESVKDLCESLKATHTYTIRFYHKYCNEKFLPENLKLMLFRIVQEQLNNVIRHARANTILIRLQNDAEELIMAIVDNGQGFDPALKKRGAGLTNIKGRAELFNGRAEIESAPGKGCTLTVTIPITNL